MQRYPPPPPVRPFPGGMEEQRSTAGIAASSPQPPHSHPPPPTVSAYTYPQALAGGGQGPPPMHAAQSVQGSVPQFPMYYPPSAPPPSASASTMAMAPPSIGRPVPTIDTSNLGSTNLPPSPHYGLQRSTSFSSTGSGSNTHSTTTGMRRNTSRIDPGQMPRPDKPPVNIVFYTKGAATNNPPSSGGGGATSSSSSSSANRKNPPSCNAIYTAIDTGNATPRHLRCTTVAPPGTRDLLLQTGLPFAIHATPFAAIEEGEESIPLVDLTRLPPETEREKEEDCPPRCTNPKCRAYINPNVIWCQADNGRSWTCNLCLTAGIPVPEWYYAPLDPVTGLRIDRNHRPELSRGSVDFVVGEEYCEKPPKVSYCVHYSL